MRDDTLLVREPDRVVIRRGDHHDGEAAHQRAVAVVALVAGPGHCGRGAGRQRMERALRLQADVEYAAVRANAPR